MSRWPLFLVAALAVAAFALPLASAAHGGPSPVHVSSDAGFDAATWSGSGTAVDPFRLRTVNVAPSQGYAVELSGTTAHVNLSGLMIAAGGASSDGIHIFSASNVTVYGGVIESSRIGIHVKASTNVTVSSVTLKTSQVGLFIESTRGAQVSDNRIQLNDKDVQLRSSTGNTFLRNNVSIAAGQFGFHFDDNASYANSIDTSNVVNALPVRWYTDVAGTPAAPFVIPAHTTDLPRITNVAQLMLHNVSHVRVDAPVAKAGTSSGIHISASRGVELVAPIAEGNTGAGVFVELSTSVRIGNASVRNNTASGALVRSSAHTNLSWSTVTGNGQYGAFVDAWSDRTRLDNLTLSANIAGGVRADRARNLTLAEVTATMNGPVGVAVASSFDVLLQNSSLTGSGSGTGLSIAATSPRVSGNTIRDHAIAVALSSVTGANFTDNTITIPRGGTGFQFDGPASYDNGIAPSNTVNGTPVRWYTRVVGPVDLPDVRVELPGITNVAQVMLYRTSNISLANLAAKNGTALGLLLHEAADTTITNATVSSNAAHGILATAGTGLRLTGSTSTANGGDGARLTAATGTTIENTQLTQNGARGLGFDTGNGATLRGNVIAQNGGVGVHLDRVGPSATAVETSVIDRNGGGGLIVNGGVLGAVRANTITSNGADGISVSGIPAGARLEQNTISGHARAIKLTSAGGTELVTNNLTISQGQTGVHFSDEASYNITAPPSNLVNGVALRWYVGTRDATVEEPSVPLAGITNIAQIMLYKVTNVTLLRPIVENGTAAGIHVFRSNNVTLEAGRAVANTGVGLRIEFSPDVRSTGTQVAGHAGDGMQVISSDRANASAVLVERNGGRGILIDASANVTVANATVTRNQGGVVVNSAATLALRANRVQHNGAVGVGLTGAPFVNLTGNLVENHTRGIELAGTGNIRAWDNTLTILDGQTGWHFSDVASYNSTIGQSNLVNGVPMRWYSRETVVDLDGSRVELRGITNIAQIMLYQTTGANLEGVIAANGSGRGLYILDAVGSRVNGARVENNTGDGVEIGTTSSVIISNSTLRTNGGAAIKSASATLKLDNVTAADGRGAGLTTTGGALQLNASTIARNAGVGVSASSPISLAVARATISGNTGAGLGVTSATALEVIDSTIRDNTGAGLSASSPARVNITSSVVTGNAADGIAITRGRAIALYDNNVSANGAAGILIDAGVLPVQVAGNTLHRQPRGIEIRNTEYGEFHANTLIILSGQTGFHFADEVSYTNTIPTTNTVNGAPVHWYTMLAGRESQRVLLPDLRSEVRGITNVAQIMIHRSAYVDISNATATNGTERGIYLYRSSAVRVTDANATNNTRYAVHLHDARSSTVLNLTAQDSGTAVQLTDAANNIVSAVDARGAASGVVLADARSQDNRVDAVRVNGTARGVTDVAWNALGLSGNNIVADAGVTKRAKLNATVALDDLMATYRLESNRIVEQSWDWGDGSPPVTSAASALHRPSRVFAATGTLVATLTVRTADGVVLTDTVDIEIVPPLSEPRAFTATGGAANVTLAWMPPLHDGAAAITKYRIYRGPVGAAPTFLAEVAGSQPRYLDTGVENGRPYAYGVAAVNSDGEGPRIAATATALAAPSAPGALRAEPAPRAVVLSWDPPPDAGGMPVSVYQVLRGTNGSAMMVVALLGNVTSYNDSGLTNGVSYTHAVRAVNAVGFSPLSANTTTTPVGPPAAPGGVRAVGADAAVLVVWTPPTDTGGLPVVGYRLWRSAPNGTLVALPGTLAANATSAREAGLSNGQEYSFGVSAINARGEGLVSALANATPSAVDALAPVLYDQTPAPGTFVTDVPVLGVRYVDNAGVNTSSVRFFLDGEELNVSASVGMDGVQHMLDAPLARGHHTVRIVVRDISENEADESWTFRVITEDERRPVFEQEEFALSVNETGPGGNVTAHVRVRNVGLEAGGFLVSVRLGENALAYAEVTVEGGETQDVTLEFSAPLVIGEYEIVVGNVTRALVVRESAAGEVDGGLSGEEPAEADANATPDAPAGPVRPVRGTPAPREEQKATPVGALVVMLALVAVARLRKRR